MINKSTKKDGKKLVWKSFTINEYQKTAMEMVHFSAKAVNSNTLPFGIRLGTNVNLALPYIAVSSIDRSNVPMDYTKNIGAPSIMSKQINAARLKSLDRFEQVPQVNIDSIMACTEILNSGYEPEDSVGIRLRQIILQDAYDHDIAVTPLPCAGLSTLINQRINEEYERENPVNDEGHRPNEKGFIRRKRAYLGVGGANPQNVGLNVRSMQKPLMFRVPMLDEYSREMRQALSIYYKGFPIKPKISILKAFILWRENLLERHFAITPSDLDVRTKEAEFLIAITNEFMARAASAGKLLHDNLEKLPDKLMCSSELPFIQQALLDVTLRTMEWRREFADFFHSKIIGQRVWIGTKKIALKNAGKHETASWISLIEGALS
jgi:hypothetical protein